MTDAFGPRRMIGLRAAARTTWMTGALLAMLAFGNDATADLEDDVRAVTAEWDESGDVKRLGHRLLERGRLEQLVLPPAWTDPSDPGCTTVALFGAPTTAFVVRFLPVVGARRWARGEFPEQSTAGGAQLVRCGRRKEMLRRLAIEMRSPRGIIETVLARAPSPVPSFRGTLPHRDPGPFNPEPALGPAPRPEAVSRRLERLRARHARAGANQVEDRIAAAGPDGAGALLIRLDPGCHRIDLLGPTPPRGYKPLDLDADLRWASDDQPIVADRTENSDASVATCFGALRIARLVFVGSAPKVPIRVVHARWSLPAGVPARWVPGVRGRIASVLRERGQPAVGDQPVYESIGVGGVTVLPIEVEPGACYVAAVAPLTGTPAGLAIAAAAGGNEAQNQSTPGETGAAIGFCSTEAERGRLEIEARGTGLSWLLGVWQAGRLSIGEEAL